MRELALELLAFVDDVVDELGSRKALDYVHTILEEGTSADQQLRGLQARPAICARSSAGWSTKRARHRTVRNDGR